MADNTSLDLRQEGTEKIVRRNDPCSCTGDCAEKQPDWSTITFELFFLKPNIKETQNLRIVNLFFWATIVYTYIFVHIYSR